MSKEIDKLRSLYLKYDTLAVAGDDVVSDLRKEINNLELSFLRDSVMPKVARLLYKEMTGLKCKIDCSIQFFEGKIEYAFCTESSPLVKASLLPDDYIDCGSSNVEMPLNHTIINKLSSSLARLSELATEIENSKTEALNYLSQLKEPYRNTTGSFALQSSEDRVSTEVWIGKNLYCRSQICNAKGKLLPNHEIIILEGSLLRKDVTPTYRSKEFRLDILSRYCSLTENGYVALRDLPPMSVSAASSLCLGRSSNGNIDWKDEFGTRLADL